jgi:tetratricopeptide (TPR) repeat protein
MADEANAADGPAGAKATVFVSYSRQDIAFVDRLEPALKARGFEPLIDRTEIYAFEDWWKRIEALILKADTIVFVISPDSVSSSVCGKEVDHAASLGKRFAPIVWRRAAPDLVPAALARLNYIFFDDDAKFDASIALLAEALETDIDWVRRHTDFGQQAQRWAVAGRPGPRGLLLRSPVLEEAERWIAARPAGAPPPTEATQSFIIESRRAATRRRNILTATLGSALIFALALAAIAFWERGAALEQLAIAESATDNASRHLSATQRTIDTVLTDLAGGLEDVEGIHVETVQRILARTETALADLAARTDNSMPVRRSQAILMYRYARIYLKLGSSDLAGQYARRATEVVRELAAADQMTISRRDDLARSLATLGDVLDAKGDRAGALAAHRESLANFRAVLAKSPSDDIVRYNLSRSLRRVGAMLRAAGNDGEALRTLREAVEIVRAMTRAQPREVGWPVELSGGLHDIGDVLAAQGDRVGALAAYRESVAVIRDVTVRDPGNGLARGSLAIALGGFGDGLAAQGDQPGALAAYRDSLDIARALSARDPANASLSANVAAMLTRVGDTLRAQGDRAGAQTALREGLVIRRALAARDASNLRWQTEVATSLASLAQAGDDPRGRLSEAVAILTRIKAQGRLSPADAKLVDALEAMLAKLPPADRR